MLTIKSPKKIPASLPNDSHRSSLKNISFFLLFYKMFCSAIAALCWKNIIFEENIRKESFNRTATTV